MKLSTFGSLALTAALVIPCFAQKAIAADFEQCARKTISSVAPKGTDIKPNALQKPTAFVGIKTNPKLPNGAVTGEVYVIEQAADKSMAFTAAMQTATTAGKAKQVDPQHAFGLTFFTSPDGKIIKYEQTIGGTGAEMQKLGERVVTLKTRMVECLSQ